MNLETFILYTTSHFHFKMETEGVLVQKFHSNGGLFMRRIKSLIWIISFILFVSFIIFVFFGNPIKYYTLKGEFEIFLENKYNQEFNVEKITFDIIHRTYHSNATPKSEPRLRFYVGQNNITKEIDDAYELEKKIFYNID